MADSVDAYGAVNRGAGLADRSGRVRLELGGPDRAKLLHNLTTQEIKGLASGRGAEAFVTTPQGKTLAYLTVLAAPDRILLRTDPAAREPLWAHLQKYAVFDDVTLEDISATTFELHLAGPRAGEIIERCGGTLPPAVELNHSETRLADRPVRVVFETPTGRPGWTLIGAQAGAQAIGDAIRSAGQPLGLVPIPPEVFDTLRIEAGTPEFGFDVTADNLPQEVDRNDRTISFTKGCYLGQETVARIDALGHVNKVLRGLKLSADRLCAVGMALEADGKRVGTITSLANSPGWACPIALGYVRTAQAAAETALYVEGLGEPAAATVMTLPMLPPC
jgi:folate-binding protein YgfZ